MDWSASQYRKFEAERNQPIYDLLSHVRTESVTRAADIGCGPGNSTEILQARYPEAEILGMDSSPDMIAAARQRLPGIGFELADIDDWNTEGAYDVLLANAVFQWVPGHEQLFPELMERLSVGGSLAIQMPDNFEEPSHRLMRETAAAGPWAEKLRAATKRVARESPQWYFRLLREKTSSLDIWRTTYFHPLKGGAAAIVEWVKGTGLRPYLDALEPAEQPDFIAAYQSALEKAYTIEADGTVLLPFPRLFIVAKR